MYSYFKMYSYRHILKQKWYEKPTRYTLSHRNMYTYRQMYNNYLVLIVIDVVIPIWGSRINHLVILASTQQHVHISAKNVKIFTKTQSVQSDIGVSTPLRPLVVALWLLRGNSRRAAPQKPVACLIGHRLLPKGSCPMAAPHGS